MEITIDCRKIQDSGVGTIIQNLMPLVIIRLSHVHFYLIGKPKQLSAFHWSQQTNATVIEAQSRPYSVAEQFEIPKLIPKQSKILWVPFINIPLFYTNKLLVTLCDVNFLALPNNLNLAQKLYAKLMYRAIYQKADHILSISQFSKDEFVRYVGMRENIDVALLGTPEKWFGVVKNRNPHPKPFFLFVGNIKPHKNLGRLVAAFNSIAADVPHDLVLVGQKEGFILSDTDVLSQGNLSNGRIQFTGHVDEDMLGQYFAHATALVFPSLYEGFGLPPLEAMACGCPIVASNSSSLPEACGDAALYCDPLSVEDIADKMLQIAQDAALREKLIAKGKIHAKFMSWESCATKTVKTIQHMLNV